MGSLASQPLLGSEDRRLSKEKRGHSVLTGRSTWSQGQVKQWAQWAQYVVPSAGDGPVEINPPEIRRAASLDPYPQWIYGALVSPDEDRQTKSEADGLAAPPPAVQASLPPAVQASLPPDILSSVQGLQEDEIRDLIVIHVDHQCCWGSGPAAKWNFKKVEDCNAFIGALESFIEEREVYSDVEPYTGQLYTTEEHGRIPGPWEVDLRDEFPLLFTLKKEARAIIPCSQRLEVCKTCSGEKEVLCPSCHQTDESGAIVGKKMAPCSVCHGRGLIAHQDGSDSECGECKGTGKQPCKQCGSRGLVKCGTCSGYGSMLHSLVVIARWRTLVNKIVSAASQAATLQDEVLQEAGGIDLHNEQAHSVQPVEFQSSYGLTKLSADVFATREPIPPSARLIVERHQLRLIPVTHVVMSNGDRSFQFYIIGLDKDIYMKNYPATCALCCCMQMCSVQ